MDFWKEIQKKIDSNETIILHIRGEQRQGMSILAHKMGLKDGEE